MQDAKDNFRNAATRGARHARACAARSSPSRAGRDHAEGVRADAARPADVRDDGRHPDHAAHAVRLRDQLRSEVAADGGRRLRHEHVRAQPRARRSRTRGYFAFVASCRASEAEADRLLAGATCSSSSSIPTGLLARAGARRAAAVLRRGRRHRPRGDRQRARRAEPARRERRCTTTSRARWRALAAGRGAVRPASSSAATTRKASRSTTSCPGLMGVILTDDDGA